MWDLIVSVPDHCLSFYLVEVGDQGVQIRFSSTSVARRANS